jgi:hypothetical protein
VATSFDSVSWEWLVRFLEHRIKDSRMIRLIQKWLKAGVLEKGVVTVSDRGTGQGSVISPLLANVYLHYTFDLWAERWRRREATGDMIIVRYADDLVVGFEHESDARRFWDAMRERLQEFSLSLHPDKTRLIEFGRHAAIKRKQRGLGKPETFNFLGFSVLQRQIERREWKTVIPVVQLRERWGQAPRDRLSGAGLKPPQAAAVKTRGRERWRKSSGHDLEQVCVRETSESEPADDASLRSKRHQNQRRESPLGQVCQVPD